MTAAFKQNCASVGAGGFALFLAVSIVYTKDAIPACERIAAVIEDISVRCAAKPFQSNEIVILDVDEASLQKLGQWPWTRYRLAELLNRLTEMGAATVAFDFIFSEPDRTSPAQIRPLWESIPGVSLPADSFAAVPDFDDGFAQALAQQGHALLGSAFYLGSSPAQAQEDPLYLRRWNNVDRDSTLAPNGLLLASEAVFPLASLRKATRCDTGYLTITPDYDRIIRRTPLLLRYGENLYSALAIEAVRLHLRKRNNLYTLHPGTGKLASVNLHESPITLDPNAVAVINYRSDLPPTYAVHKFLKGDVPKEMINGKLIFIGTSAIGLHDLVNTPLNKSISGVYVHATLADNMLSRDLLHTVPRSVWSAFIIAVGGLAIAATLLLSIPWATLTTLLLSAFSFALTVYLRRHVYAASPFEPLFATSVGFGLTALVRFISIDQQRKRIREIFGSMVSHQLLRHLEKSPSRTLFMESERKTVTVLFTDLEGFTSISERLSPKLLTDLLRSYFEPMTEICLQHGAYINKFIGDAIMAVYNVPGDLPNHVEEAVRSACEMQEKLNELRPFFEQTYGITLRMRIGIHTGEATAGNMGSAKRFEYTVLGDTVNVASRLESENKNHGTWILVSDAVASQLPPDLKSRPVGEIHIRNRDRPLLVHEIVC